MSKTLLKMVSFVEADILQGTAGVCLQGEIEMLVFKIALISQSMNNCMVCWCFFSFGYYLCFYMHKENYPHTMYKSVRNLS